MGEDRLYPAEIARRTGVSIEKLAVHLDYLVRASYIAGGSDGFGGIYFLTETGRNAVGEHSALRQ